MAGLGKSRVNSRASRLVAHFFVFENDSNVVEN